VNTLSTAQFEAALRAVESEDATPEEKAEMLMEIAMGLQQKPKTSRQLEEAVELYQRALEICPPAAATLRARIQARQGTAYQALPAGGRDALFKARDCFEASLKSLKVLGTPEEVAEVEMNLGLVTQSLAQSGAGRIQDAIQSYHRALRTFNKESYPGEFAILHNNLAIAYLSIPMSDERGKMSEALAVQSFEEVLKVVNIVDQPVEYAMIQNNLGNALQYVSSGHVVENNLRALTAYDEALKVRNRRDTPLEYANTISNKANVLRNLPDNPAHPELGNQDNLLQARALYTEAHEIFSGFGQTGGAEIVAEAMAEIERELTLASTSVNGKLH
jgi:tetratricopeptide (TPR) repeat protein